MSVQRIGYYIVGLVWMASVHLYAGISVTGAFAPADRSPAYISVLSDTSLVAQAQVVQGRYTMELPSTLSQGIYRLAFSTQDRMRFYFIHTGQTSYEIDYTYRDGQWFQLSSSSVSHRQLSEVSQRLDTVLKPLRSLYAFVGSYPEKSSSIYQIAWMTIENKKSAYEQFYQQKVAMASPYVSAILQANKPEIYPVDWSDDSVEHYREQTYWTKAPLQDTAYYRSPFFIERLDDFFAPYLDQTGFYARLSEREKYIQIRKRLLLCLSQWKKSKGYDHYATVAIRYFLNKGYSYLIRYIDSTVSPQRMIAQVDGLQLAYRKEGEGIRQKMTLSELLCTDRIVTDTPDRILYVGSPTTYGRSALAQLDSVSRRDGRRVHGVIVQHDTESTQHFRSKYPHWSFSIIDEKDIPHWVEKHHMYYLPLVYELDSHARYQREWYPFE